MRAALFLAVATFVACGSATPPPAPAPKPVAPAPMKPAMPAATTAAVFPSAVSPTYSTLKAGQARMKTCDDQWKANKAAGGAGNGGLQWIQKGGGYYSECNKRLKGA